MCKELGPQMAQKLMQRMVELKAADRLSDLTHLPPMRAHELTNRGGLFSVDLKYPFRLLFRPADKPPPQLPDGGINRSEVREILIVKIEDTHDPKNQRRRE